MKKIGNKRKHVYDGKIEKIHITSFYLTLQPTLPRQYDWWFAR